VGGMEGEIPRRTDRNGRTALASETLLALKGLAQGEAQ